MGTASRAGSSQPCLPENIRLRPLRVGDCLEQITGMLHRAFARLLDMGIACTCANQTSETTRRRVGGGVCFVAVAGDCIVGTITLSAPDAASDSRHYRQAGVASVRQLAVDPRFQAQGIGKALLHVAACLARDLGYGSLALNTPEAAAHLIGYYRSQGFRLVEQLQFSGRPYCSAVLSKTVLQAAIRDHRPLRPFPGSSRCGPGSGCVLRLFRRPSKAAAER